MQNLYFVTARKGGWDTVFGGHWLADSPKAAIALAQETIRTNTTGIGLSTCEGLTFKATKSKAKDNSNALNAVRPQQWHGMGGNFSHLDPK